MKVLTREFAMPFALCNIHATRTCPPPSPYPFSYSVTDAAILPHTVFPPRPLSVHVKSRAIHQFGSSPTCKPSVFVYFIMNPVTSFTHLIKMSKFCLAPQFRRINVNSWASSMSTSTIIYCHGIFAVLRRLQLFPVSALKSRLSCVTSALAKSMICT